MHIGHHRAIGALAAAALGIGLVVGTGGLAVAATPSPAATAATPSLAQQDATADHVMGASEAQASATPALVPAPTVGTPGFDVSYYQGATPNFAGAYAAGARFVFVKTTEGTPGTSSTSQNATGSANRYAAQQYSAAKAAGLLVGEYHYALPYYSSGPTQARFFLDHSTAWTSDGKTLPPVLDMEVNTAAPVQGNRCWGLSASDMVSWIQGWVATVVAAEGVQPMIYTNQDFWNTCTGGSTAFPKDRLFVASYPSSATNTPVMPTGFADWTFWQWSQNTDGTGTFPGDQNVFNGSLTQLQALTGQGSRAVGRISGGSAYETSANIAASAFTPSVTLDGNSEARQPGTTTTAYVATRASYPDALSAAAAAGHQGAPVLLTDPNTLPTATAAELTQLQPRNIVLVGGPSAVSATVVSALGYWAPVQRVFGNSRYETSASLAEAFAPESAAAYPAGLTAYIATGTNFPDALAGAAVAAGSRAPGPMLLVQPDAIPTAIAAQLTRLQPTRIVILGGTSAVAQSVQDQLAGYVGGDTTRVERWAGQDRFDTSVVIAQKALWTSDTAFVATGTNFPDALAGGPAAGYFGAPVLLTRPDVVPDDVRVELSLLGAKGVVVLGGPSAVNAAVEASL